MDNQKNFLAEIVKGNDLVKHHQIHIPEIILRLGEKFQRRLAVLQIIVRKISHQASAECGEPFHLRTPVLLQQPAYFLLRTPGHPGFDLKALLSGQVSRPVGSGCTACSIRRLPVPPDLHRHSSIHTGQLHCGIIAEKRVSAPSLPVLDTLKQKAVAAHTFQNFQRLHRRPDIRKNFPIYRKPLKISRRIQFLCLFQRCLFHKCSFPVTVQLTEQLPFPVSAHVPPFPQTGSGHTENVFREPVLPVNTAVGCCFLQKKKPLTERILSVKGESSEIQTPVVPPCFCGYTTTHLPEYHHIPGN